jgi:hypothetical protein
MSVASAVRLRSFRAQAASHVAVRKGPHRTGLSGFAVDPLFGSMPTNEVADLLLGFLARDPVATLHLADELVLIAFDLQQIVVGEPAPLFLDLALELLPATLDLILVHRILQTD